MTAEKASKSYSKSRQNEAASQPAAGRGVAGLSARVADGWRAYRRTADAKINVVIALQDEPQHVFGKHRTDSRLAAVTAASFFFKLNSK